jgi:dipeptidyl aminopeptidase/acylaminoacyl peptidase
MSDRPVAELARHWARYPIIWSPRVSGDGKWLAWTWTGLADTGEVWVVPTDGSAPPERLTHGRDHFYARGLSHDGSQVVLAQSIGSNEHDRLFLLDRAVTGAEPRPLTPLQSQNYVFGGTLDRAARQLFYSADFDNETRVAAEGSRIHRLDLATGASRVLARAKSVCEFEPELSPDGNLVLYSRCDRHAAGNQIWVVAVDGTGDREIMNAGDRFKVQAQWLGRDHLLLVQAETPTHERVGILDVDSGKTRWLIDDPTRCIEGIVAGRDGRTAMVLDYVEGRLEVKLLDTDTGTATTFAVPGVSLLPVAELPGGDWICEAYHSRGAHDLVRVDPKTMRVTNLTRAEVHVAGIRFTPAQDFRWRSSDETPIQGWLYEPQMPSRGLVVWVHGGPTWHSEDRVNPIIQFLVAAGFTVLDPNYRGSTGFGTAFRESIKIDGWGGREQDDIRSGIEALIAASKAKRGRIGVAGLSYGGYSSWIAITRFADLVGASVPICGMYQLDVDYHATGMPHGRAYSIEMMGGAPEQMPERYFNASPANFIRNIRGKILIVHGLADSNVSPENTRLACRNLDAAGIPYERLTFANEGHGIYKAGNREILLLRMENLFSTAFK